MPDKEIFQEHINLRGFDRWLLRLYGILFNKMKYVFVVWLWQEGYQMLINLFHRLEYHLINQDQDLLDQIHCSFRLDLNAMSFLFF